jgi:hypothetical protein
MAQFDVLRSPVRGRPDAPFVVIIQSAWFDNTPDRLVAPMLMAEAARDLNPPRHMPRFRVAEQWVMVDTLQIRPVPRQRLGPVITSLADDNSAVEIITAIDHVISRSRG